MWRCGRSEFERMATQAVRSGKCWLAIQIGPRTIVRLGGHHRLARQPVTSAIQKCVLQDREQPAFQVGRCAQPSALILVAQLCLLNQIIRLGRIRGQGKREPPQSG